MDSLPSEVLQVICRNLRGIDFVRLKKVSKWIHFVANDLERKDIPALWWKFVFRDYLHSCLESLAPWVYNSDVNNSVLWKQLYIKLYRTSLLAKQSRITQQEILTEGVKLVTDVVYIYGYLFLKTTSQAVNLIGLSDKLRLKSHYETVHSSHQVSLEEDLALTPITLVKKGSNNSEVKLQKLVNNDSGGYRFENNVTLKVCSKLSGDFSKGLSFSYWTDTCIVYAKEYIFAKSTIDLYDYGENEVKLLRSISLQNPIPDISNITYNQKRVVLTSAGLTIHLLPNDSTGSVISQCYPLPKQVLKMKMVGDLIICLFDDFTVATSQVITNQKRRHFLTQWQMLDLDALDSKAYPQFFCIILKIMDFVLLGHLFAMITDCGSVFLSYLDELNHTSLADNLRPVFDVPMHHNGIVTRMSVDLEDGIRFAVLERFFDGVMWISQVHIFQLN